MSTATSTTTTAGTKRSWRDWLPVHPAADLFPPVSLDELRALADDIKRHRLHQRAVFVTNAEGRPELDALELNRHAGHRWSPVFFQTF
jgi:hypothetical protein